MNTEADDRDSVSLADLADAAEASNRAKSPRLRMANLKLLVTLFFLFVVVVSDVFTNSVIAGFGEKAVRCRAPTSWGVVLQGVFLVIMYILAIYLSERGIL